MFRATGHFRLPLFVILSFVVVNAIGQPQPATQPSAKPAPPALAAPPAARPAADQTDFVVSPMRVQNMKATNYLYASTETTLNEMGEFIHATIDAMEQGMKNGSFHPDGPALFLYHGITQDPTHKFTLDVGFPVADGTKEFADFKVKALEQYHCATVLYSGPIMSIGQGYQQLFADLIGAGLQPTGEVRDYYLMWEGPESVNNVTLIAVEVKE
jgi:effector-binding domain-containing protein